MKKVYLTALIIVLSVLVLIITINQYTIMHPKHVSIPKYLDSWLTTPQKHNIIIEKNHIDGIFYLIVKYKSQDIITKRVHKLRQQLERYGINESNLQDNGLLVMLHGKNMRKEYLLPIAQRYASSGFTCILIDLPGHGESIEPIRSYGQNYKESHYISTVLENIKSRHKQVINKPLYLWGMSLGGTYVLSNSIHTQPKAIILVSTFDKLSYVLKEKSENLFGKYLGFVLYKLLNYSLSFFYSFNPEEVDSIKYAKQLSVPVMLFHGKKDTFIHYKHGENLFQNFSNTYKKMILDKEGNHKNIFITSYPFYAESIKFLLESKNKQ